MFRSCFQFPHTHLFPPARPSPRRRQGGERTWPRRLGRSEPEPARPSRAAQGPDAFPPCSPSNQRKGGTCPKPSPPGGTLGYPLLRATTTLSPPEPLSRVFSEH